VVKSGARQLGREQSTVSTYKGGVSCHIMNYCIVKYIHLKDVDSKSLHTTQDFEYSSALIGHATFEEMEQRVQENCPENFVCFYPIAMHHEVLWRTSLKVTGKGLVELDQLFQPIDAVDYRAIRWSRIRDGKSTPTVCVHIQQEAVMGVVG
jgi:hypothetical protein